MKFELAKQETELLNDWGIQSSKGQIIYKLVNGCLVVGLIVIEEKDDILIKDIKVRESYQGQGLSRWMVNNLLFLYQKKNLRVVGNEDYFKKLGFEFHHNIGLLINDDDQSGKKGDWESFEIFNYAGDHMLQLFYKDIKDDDVYLNRHYKILNGLKGRINTPVIVGTMIIDDRIGFILEKKNDLLMAIEIRNNPTDHESIAYHMARLHHDIHNVNLELELRHHKDYIKVFLDKLKMLPDYKKKLLDTFDSLPIEHDFCNNDYGAYHVFKSQDEYYVFDWSSASYGDRHADIAKSIFWLCSNYVAGIGAYLLSKDIKVAFVNHYLKAYGSVDMNRIIDYLIIFAAIEYDTEIQDEGLTPEIELLYQMIVDYYDGKEINIFDYLIYESCQ